MYLRVCSVIPPMSRRTHWQITGIGSAAAFRLNNSDPEGLSSVLQIGVAYAMGVMLAFVVSNSNRHKRIGKGSRCR